MEQRVQLAVDLSLEFLDATGTVIYCEPTVTEYITPNGARVLTHARIPVGEVLVVKTPNGHFSSPAIVKTSEVGTDSIPRITVEFLNRDLKGWYLEETPTLKTQYKELLQRSQESFLLLNIVISELEQNNPPDVIFLDELKTSIDVLRTVIFRAQRMQNEK